MRKKCKILVKVLNGNVIRELRSKSKSKKDKLKKEKSELTEPKAGPGSSMATIHPQRRPSMKRDQQSAHASLIIC